MLLLGHGTDVEAEDEYGTSAMDVALYFGNVLIVKGLLSNSARLRIERNGNTALHAIASNFNDQAIRRIRRIRSEEKG